MTPNHYLGKIYYISNPYSVTTRNGNSITKRDLYLAVQMRDKVNYLHFEQSGERCDVLNGHNVGEDVAVLFSVFGKFYDSGMKNPDGSIYYKHMQTESVYEIMSIEDFRKREEEGWQRSNNVSVDADFARSLNTTNQQAATQQSASLGPQSNGAQYDFDPLA